MLTTGINDDIAGRFRQARDFVRVGTYIALASEHVKRMIEQTLNEYKKTKIILYTK